ncbi:MAG: FAD-dependent oxidoreductase [Endomicrobiales bacterium]|nr:FAD-dependent oxidoreductase [Endomicrobiales bacterium]
MKIIIAGGGFAGLGCLDTIDKNVISDPNNAVMLFDKNPYTTMIPSLPDLAGGNIEKDMLVQEIKKIVPDRVCFKQETIQSIDLTLNRITTDKGSYDYDYLVIGTGSITNYYGFSDHIANIYKLDSVSDAVKISASFKDYLTRGTGKDVLVNGAGFTGIEAASNLYSAAKKTGKNVNIHISEKADKLFGNMDEAMRLYLAAYCKKMGFNLMPGCEVRRFDGKDVYLSNGNVIKDAFFCWCAGTKIAVDIKANMERLFDGRIKVNECLQIPEYPNVFVAGDSAAIAGKNGYLRKAVNFSLFSGRKAGENISRCINKKPLSKFVPVDLGWVIPLYRSSVGVALGKRIRGRIGLKLHYLMCGYRSRSMLNTIKYFIKAITS